MPQSIILSIVATSYTMDRFKDVCDLFDSIQAQEFNPQSGYLRSISQIETIFIAERSQELYERVKDHADKIALPNFKILFSDKVLFLSGARELGAKEATGEIIAFVDDDSVLFPEWAEQMVGTYKDDTIIGVSGTAIPMWQDNKLDWLPREYYWLISCTDWTGWEEVTEARSLWGMNMSLRREAFEKTRAFITSIGHRDAFFGFREPPIAEDLEFSLRVKKRTGKKLLFNPGARVYHKVYAYRVSPGFIASRARHIGVSRRILRAAGIREQVNFKLERGVIRGIFRILFRTPLEMLRNPLIGWKKFSTTVIIVIFAAIGFLFPGKNIVVAREIRHSFE